MTANRLEPAARQCLEQTRTSVLNVLVAVGIGIAASGLYLRGRDRGALFWPERTAARTSYLLLLGLVLASFATRRVGASRSALKDAEGRGARFYRAHLSSAIIGALAVPLGLLYAWAVRPRLDAVAPFWIAALALGVLALPRAYELEDFETPMLGLGEPES